MLDDEGHLPGLSRGSGVAHARTVRAARDVATSGLACLGAIVGCDGTRVPAIPTPLAPSEGQATGSVWSTRAAPNPLRPQFRWTAVAGAASYQIQIDDSCVVSTYCPFSSPEVDAQSASPSFVPAADLPVSMTPPVGRRYFWRVRACDASGTCDAWSRTSGVDVGRQRQDFNGDGYADLAVVALSRGGNALFVYLGGAALPTSPGWTIRGNPSPVSGLAFVFDRVLWMGDMNGDGFADLAVVIRREGGDSVRVYFGGTAPATEPAVEIADSASVGSNLQTILPGDMNGDGFADLFQSYVSEVAGTYVVSFGPLLATGTAAPAPSSFAVVASCDFDSDGYPDLIESGISELRGGPSGPFDGSAPQPISVPGGSGVVACGWNFNGLGSASLLLDNGLDEVPALRLASSSVVPGAANCDGVLPALSAGARDGNVVPLATSVADVGDADGDGYDDLLIGDRLNNRAALFFGGCPVERVTELPGANEFGGTPGTGATVAAAGDLDGDGFADFAVANVFGGIDDACTGEVYLYRGGTDFASETAPTAVLTDPDHVVMPGGCAEDGFGVSLD